MSFKKTGDWDEVERFLKEAPGKIDRINQRSLKRVGLKAEKMAVKFIKSQSLSHRRLDEKYLESKVKKGKSNKILISDGHYLQAITSTTEDNVAFAGVNKTVKNKDGGSTANIARVQEFGSIARNIPARPVWLPVFNRMKTLVVNKNFFVTEVMKEIKK